MKSIQILRFTAVTILMAAGAGSLCASDFTVNFEGGYLRGWTKTGTAFDSQPTLGDNPTARYRGQPAQNEGDWWIGTYEKYQGLPGQNPGEIQGDALTGTLTSPSFKILGEEINFLIGGGNHNETDPNGATMVVIEIEGAISRSFTGNDSETMTRVRMPVGAYKGTMAVIKIIDNHSGGWGHINCDDFQMLDAHGQQLPFATEDSAPDRARLSVHPAPSGPDWATGLASWMTIEDRSDPPVRTPKSAMCTGIFTEDAADLSITFSAEIGGSAGARVLVRALVDGLPASPTDVVFTMDKFSGTRAFNFIKQNLAAGGHWVEMQWSTDVGTASVGDATLNLFSSSTLNQTARLCVHAAPGGPAAATSSGAWEPIPDLSGTVVTSATSDVAITLSAEAYSGDTAHSMFVRAFVDGVLALPSDVEFSRSTFTGVKSFTFGVQALPPGEHQITLQWLTSAGGTAYLGDRTMTVVAAPLLTKHGGLTLVAAPSGPDKTIGLSSWIDIPDLAASIATAANSQLAISFSAELDSTPGKRLFVRALVDGQPAQPTDVIIATGNSYGVRSFTFTASGISAGPHQVRMQWSVDSGGTGSIGDRTVMLNYWRSDVIDLSTPWSGIKPVTGTRRVLTILWDPRRPDHPAPTQSTIETLLFGPRPSVADYFRENSGGRLRLENAGVMGWYDALQPASYYWGPEDTGDANGDGWIHPHVQKWAEAIRAADAQFNYAAYDANQDGYLSPDELAILMVIPQNLPFGTMNFPVGRESPRQSLVVDGVRIDTISEVYIGAPPSLGVTAHELAHLLLGAGDMYFGYFQPYAAGPYSLMDQSPNQAGHLDPIHKLHLGWLVPRIITSDAWCHLSDVETTQSALLLYNPDHSPNEYFLVENRWRGNSYDTGLPCSGLAVWHGIENPAVYSTLPTPAGVDATKWVDPAWTGWARRAIRSIRPIYGPPYNTALWDGSSITTGYDLLSNDANASHQTLKWADGSPSGFNLLCLPASGPRVAVGVVRNGASLTTPPLAIRLMGNQVQLSWPAALTCLRLEVADHLAPANWVSWFGAIQVGGDEKVVLIQVGSKPQYYRLVKP
jgi:M6 family metalloprotease-like protein